MSNAQLNVFIRVVSRRIANGESIEDILDSYPKLSEADKEQIREAVSDNE